MNRIIQLSEVEYNKLVQASNLNESEINEKLLRDNKRMRKLINYLVVSYILTILCFLILIKQLGL